MKILMMINNNMQYANLSKNDYIEILINFQGKIKLCRIIINESNENYNLIMGDMITLPGSNECISYNTIYDVIGMNEKDVRGWVIVTPDKNQ